MYLAFLWIARQVNYRPLLCGVWYCLQLVFMPHIFKMLQDFPEADEHSITSSLFT